MVQKQRYVEEKYLVVGMGGVGQEIIERPNRWLLAQEVPGNPLAISGLSGTLWHRVWTPECASAIYISLLVLALYVIVCFWS